MNTSIPHSSHRAPDSGLAGEDLLLLAATPDGTVPLPVAPGADNLNDAFDSLPLGSYEGLRTVDSTRLVGLPEHLARAERSIARLGWDYELDRTTLCTCLATTLADQHGGDYRVRFDVLAEAIDTPNGPTRLVIGLSPLVLPTREDYADGVGVETLSELERSSPLIKDAQFVLDRRPFPLDRPEAYERLLVDDSGRLLECTASSFFGVRGQTILAATGGVLEGITAGFIERVAAGAGFRYERQDLYVRDLPSLDEAFLTSSIKGVVPVVRVDGEAISNGSPGPVTRRLMARYQEFIQADARPALDALGTPAR